MHLSLCLHVHHSKCPLGAPAHVWKAYLNGPGWVSICCTCVPWSWASRSQEVLGGMRQLQQRTEFCWDRERRENFNRNSSSVLKLKIKLYHKGQCDQAQLTIFSFPCFYQHLSSTGVAFSRGSQQGSEVLYQWVFFPLRKEENPFKIDHFQEDSSLSDSCVCSWQIQLCSLWLVGHSGQAAVRIITVLFT